MRKVKGVTLSTVLLIIIGVVAVGVGVFFLGRGLGWWGGKGDNEGSGNAEPVQQVNATVQTTEAITTQEIFYIEVTVSENKYIFNNTTYEIEELEALISDIKAAKKEFTVRITDEYASDKAYEKLKSELNNEKIKFIETS